MSVIQTDLFGKRIRTGSWHALIEEAMLVIGETDLNKEEYNRLVAAQTIILCPKTDDVLKAIMDMNDLEYAKRALRGLLRSRDIPSMETIARGQRSVKEQWHGLGKVLPFQEKRREETIDDILIEALEQTHNHYSGMETRFFSLLCREIPEGNWRENFKVDRANEYFRYDPRIIDIVSLIYKISIEIDSWSFHRSMRSFSMDRQKARMMQGLGFVHLQFTGSELAIPCGFKNVIEEIKWFVKRINQPPSPPSPALD